MECEAPGAEALFERSTSGNHTGGASINSQVPPKLSQAPKNEISKMICAVREAVVGVSTLFYRVILNEGVAMEACVEQLVYTPHYVVIYRPLRG